MKKEIIKLANGSLEVVHWNDSKGAHTEIVGTIPHKKASTKKVKLNKYEFTQPKAR